VTKSILYCGDTDLSGAASYLAGLMTLWGWEYDYVPSHVPLSREHVEQPQSLFVFSDYPATQVADELQRPIIEQVRAGAGLLMIGGWESFHGMGGDWDTNELGRILPVQISSQDDRINSHRPSALVLNRLNERPQDAHPILRGSYWEDQPPFVGGWNQVRYRRGLQLLTIEQYRVLRAGGVLEGELSAQYPGLVIDELESGRTAAFMSDVAPHWVGGFVDWGDARVTAQAPGAPAIEVGNWYAQFWRQLLTWTGRLS
jgi:uncharacterized membrane protein